MSPHGRVHGVSQRTGTPCRRGSLNSILKESIAIFKESIAIFKEFIAIFKESIAMLKEFFAMLKESLVTSTYHNWNARYHPYAF